MTKQWSEIGLNVLVISLQKSIERRSRLEARMFNAGIAFNYVEAVDGDDEASLHELYLCDSDSEKWIYKHRSTSIITDREIACTLSHMKAVCQAYANGYAFTLICEDDVELLDGVTANEIEKILKQLPNDASYLQLCVTPERSVRQLAEFTSQTGQLYATKSSNSPTCMDAPFFDNYPIHCATAYVVTIKGAANLSNNFFTNKKTIFPCDPATLKTNVALVADQFVYRACTNKDTKGYVYCVPILTYEALDSLLHSDHLDRHRATKITAMELRSKLTQKRKQ